MRTVASRPAEHALRTEPAARSRPAMPLVPALVALALSVLGIWNPSFWLDESATISIAQRPVPEMMRFFETQDLVHAFYYLLMRPWMEVFGTSETAMRLPSAFAMAAAAAGVAAVGRRISSPTAGLLAGLAFACSVTVTRFGQEARSYALVTAAAVLATYLFVRAVEAPRRSWWWAGYAVVVTTLGALHIFGVFLLAAHGLTLVWRARRRPVLLGWLVAAGVGAAALMPLVLAAKGQSEQVNWIPPLDRRQLWEFLTFLAGGKALLPVVAALAICGVVAGWAAPRAAGLTLTSVGLPWLVVPPLLLMAMSLSDSSFLPRYLLFCIPGLALLVGTGLAWLIEARWWWPVAVVAVALLAVLSVPEHVKARQQTSKLDDLRSGADVLRANARSGDALLFLTSISRWSWAAYPDATRGLQDVMLDQTPEETANLRGVSIKKPAELRERLRTIERVWVVWDRELKAAPPSRTDWQYGVLSSRFRPERIWRYKGGHLTLYVALPTGGQGDVHGSRAHPAGAPGGGLTELQFFVTNGGLFG
jgi:mannosyltransferase